DARTRKERQYYEMLGHRAIYVDGWKAVSFHMPGSSFDADKWELYHIDEDFSECSDLADEHPEKLQTLIDGWWEEAERYNVLPLADNLSIRFPSATKPGRRFTFYPGKASVPSRRAPNIGDRSHRITADIDRSTTSDEGVLIAQGGRHGGYAFFIKDNRLCYEFNFLGLQKFRVESEGELPAGKLTVRADFTKTGTLQGVMRIYANGAKIGEGEITRTTRLGLGLLEPLDIGRDRQTPVSDLYECPFEFTGKLERVEVTVGGRETLDPLAELDELLAVE
ncbi:MAG: arylsulfatase, partial [Dehalococcoidia bacterium]